MRGLYSPHVPLLVAELAVRVALHTLQKLTLHLCGGRRGRGGWVALWVPVSHLLAVSIRVLRSRQRL